MIFGILSPYVLALSAVMIYGRQLGIRGVSFVYLWFTGCSFICCVVAVVDNLWSASLVALPLGVWFEVGTLSIAWKFTLVDPYLMTTVSGVSFLVQLFSLVYLVSDRSFILGLSWIVSFTFFMLVLATADQLLMLLVGWEGIGVCSCALIGFWSTRVTATKSALKAVLVNRLGDGLLLFAVIAHYAYSGISSPDVMSFYDAPTFVSFAFFLGAIGKSAQIGFAIWLADAMEGPTPVSALIHAATLVTAGILLMLRTGALCRGGLVILGIATCISAATMGLMQSDAKRVIAYSTCSQLGYMMISHGLGHSSLAIAHLLTHACFKAALFLGAGSVIHVASSWQDQRRSGSTAVASMPAVISTFSLMGLPFMSGFYSKDAILEVSWVVSEPMADSANLAMLLVVGFTMCYGFNICWSSYAASPSIKPTKV